MKPLRANLRQIYTYLRENSNALIERGIAFYHDMLAGEPDLLISLLCDGKGNCEKATIVLNSSYILSHLPSDLAKYIKENHAQMIPAAAAYNILSRLDSILDTEIFRIVENIVNGTRVSEYYLVIYRPKVNIPPYLF